jgi:tRNA G18 (ribose-2'-O)-methylase SpoU
MTFGSKEQKIDWSILLHDIRSVQNVASIFRMAEVLGVNKIFLSGVTPGPLDRFGFERQDFIKISLGTEKRVKWERLEENVLEFISNFKNNEDVSEKDLVNSPLRIPWHAASAGSFPKSFSSKDMLNIVIALEQSENSVDYKKVEIDENKKYLIIPGREVEGLDENILKLCDIVAEIPQYGTKESLNIFSSMSIACFRFFDKGTLIH